MQHILILGVGRSSLSLIKYLLDQSEENDWQLTVADQMLNSGLAMWQGHPRLMLSRLDVMDQFRLSELVTGADVVISMLPPKLHIIVARECLLRERDLVTASYISEEMRLLTDEVERKGLLFLNEIGLDPGIDHMSAMSVINRLRDSGKQLTAFETFTGGLLAPNDAIENPWDYKFTWNPKNVVEAGKGVVKFIQQGKYKYIPYQKLYRRTEPIFISGYGHFEGYANRDSLKYLDVYGLRGIKTLYRGTLRRPGFCRTWDIFVQLGATDDSYEMEGVKNMTHREFINSFLSYNPSDSVELKLAHYLNLELDGPEIHRLKWSGFFEEDLIGLEKGTPAQILEHILKKKWSMEANDIDMIVMWHKFNYLESDQEKEIHSTLVAKGDDELFTAMSKTVGYPVGIATKLILQGKISVKGVKIPIFEEIYKPVLAELKGLGFELEEHEKS
ncbi:MAG: saccharopine dehydrogenase NADP-binding domain-containing protein [Cyclobacteriaceae bacterium]|nr:saccharopine dehydrogenase NADP-binding domain-containing protein [Cyclobacteriaceae bacterium]